MFLNSGLSFVLTPPQPLPRLLAAGTHRLSSVHVYERDAAVYCTVAVHSRGSLRKFAFLLSSANENFLPDLSEASQELCSRTRTSKRTTDAVRCGKW